MNNLMRSLFVLGFLFWVALNGFVFFKGQALFLDNKKSLSMIIRASGIQAKLDSFESEIWNIVYQPSTSREVLNGHSKAYQAILSDIRKDIAAAEMYSSEGKPHQQIELVRRSMDSLTRKADRLRAQLVLQDLDIDSTKVFFKDTDKTSMLAESHVVEMEEIMKKINDNVDVISENIDKYIVEEVIFFAAMNEHRLAVYHRWWWTMFALNICYLFAGAWFLARKRGQAQYG